MDIATAYEIVARDLGWRVEDLQKLRAKAPAPGTASATPRLKWGKNNAPDENPAAFAWRAYQAEAKAGTLHMGITRQAEAGKAMPATAPRTEGQRLYDALRHRRQRALRRGHAAAM
jgi:hypothetical protein